MERLFEVLYEDAELLAVNKPAGLVCHPTKTDQYSSLISRARLYLGQQSRPELINRLDRETSGVTLLAKTRESARKARRLWEGRQVTKQYWAIVHGRPDQNHGVINAPLGKDEKSRVAIKDCVRSDGAEASTEFWVERDFQKPIGATSDTAVRSASLAGTLSTFSLLRVVPHTGRKHQIRIHLAYVGHPIVGDKLYGPDEELYLALVDNRLSPQDWARLILPYHALHAAQVQFQWSDELKVFQAQPEPWFKAFCCFTSAPA